MMAKKPIKKSAKKSVTKKVVKQPIAKKCKPVVKKVINIMDFSKVETKDYLIIKPINPESKSMGEALGITEERMRELHDLARKAFRTTLKISEAGAVVSTSMKHANELMYIMFVLSDMHHHTQNPLFEFLQNLRGGE